MTIGNHLVNTDATRQGNVLDLIGNIAQHVQVLIVTCHGERYRGFGKRQEIKEAEAHACRWWRNVLDSEEAPAIIGDWIPYTER